ncbi:MAG TPA: FAD-dependent monooxygenase, partial [Dehalococcoidia bacterium]
RGYSVLLVDKATFPSDIMSTHFIQIPGIERLRRWGLLDRLAATNAPAITKFSFSMGDLTFSPPVPEGEFGAPTAYCPRRTVLDKILVDAAVEAGAELREEFPVRELMFDGDRVVGVRGGRDGGVAEEARIVIGADGMRSLVARTMKAPEYKALPSLSYGYYSYFSGVEQDGAELHFLDGRGCLCFPTNDGCVCLGVGGAIDNFHEFRKDIEGNYMSMLDGAGTLPERVRAGKREAPFQGTADQPNYFRKPYGDGWALVGDAGYHRDFITGLGITDAFRDAELLSDALHAAFSGTQPIEEALSGYERTRNDIATPLYEFTTSLVANAAPPDLGAFAQFGLALSRT